MKIYSWNVNSANKRLDEVISFIRKSDFDVFCLQEVPVSLLKSLQDLPVHLCYALDFARIFSDKQIPYYVVILTKHEIAGSKSFALSERTFDSARTRGFVAFMKIFGWSVVRRHQGIFADIRMDGQTFRVFSLHLRLNSPSERMKELQTAAAHMNPPSIICGDFNVIDRWFLKPFSWLMGSTLREASPFFPEREQFETYVLSIGLRNVLRGRQTHILGTQLDHILIPDKSDVVHAGVHPARQGSDHYPVYAELRR